MLTLRLIQLCALGVVANAAALEARGEDLPLVDLEYAVHKASFDAENELYSFDNIRYAEPPLGERRFRHPAPMTTVNRTVNDGSYGFGCTQGYPAMVVDELAKEGESPEETRVRLTGNPAWNEDCLFLNVVVPKAVFQKRRTKHSSSKSCGGEKAPVMVWIYGGQFAMGWKDEREHNPKGLVVRSQADGSDGMIHVAFNYRLGMFGFVNGEEGDERIQPNAGLLDQRLALEWVQDNIHLFGGDADNVTVMGQSAGGASIICHITAEGGKAKTLFKNAIVQSPGFATADKHNPWSTTLKTASKISGKDITTGEELAALSAAQLREINSMAIFEAGLTIGLYGPFPYGAYVPDYPWTLLKNGQFDKSPKVISGYTNNETIVYLPPGFEQAIDLETVISISVGPLSDEEKEYVLRELYPPVGATDLYYSAWGRLLLLSSDMMFNCFAWQLSDAFGHKAWDYQFDVKPAWHGQDVEHTYYGNGYPNPKEVNTEAALAMQTYFTTLAAKGAPDPGDRDLPQWPWYGDEEAVMRFIEGGAVVDKDDAGRAKRCSYWRKVSTGEIS